MSRAEELNQYIQELFDYWDGKNDDFEPIPIPKEVDDEMQRDSFIKAETGQQSPRQRPDGDRRSDDGKPRDSVSDTVGNMVAGGLAKRFTVGQQVFNDFLR